MNAVAPHPKSTLYSDMSIQLIARRCAGKMLLRGRFLAS
jgi:hypothetical protein